MEFGFKHKSAGFNNTNVVLCSAEGKQPVAYYCIAWASYIVVELVLSRLRKWICRREVDFNPALPDFLTSALHD